MSVALAPRLLFVAATRPAANYYNTRLLSHITSTVSSSNHHEQLFCCNRRWYNRNRHIALRSKAKQIKLTAIKSIVGNNKATDVLSQVLALAVLCSSSITCSAGTQQLVAAMTSQQSVGGTVARCQDRLGSLTVDQFELRTCAMCYGYLPFLGKQFHPVPPHNTWSPLHTVPPHFDRLAFIRANNTVGEVCSVRCLSIIVQADNAPLCVQY